MSIRQHTEFLKLHADRLGFLSCGIAEAKPLDEDARRLAAWLNKGFHGKMKYMENHFDLRTDPTKLVPGAKSVITLLFNYFPKENQSSSAPKIARYAFGNDYHLVIREKLNELLSLLRSEIGNINGRGFVDSAPVLERSWAKNAGLGWIGKNGNLITKHAGSYLFIATLITDLELGFNNPFVTDHCGTCTQCIDACPTQALVGPQNLDASKCISYLTIELKDALVPTEFHEKMSGWMFGCDICQEVCPWNRFAKPNHEAAFTPIPEILNLSSGEWQEMSKETFDRVFRKSALKRTKFEGIQRNIGLLKSLS